MRIIKFYVTEYRPHGFLVYVMRVGLGLDLFAVCMCGGLPCPVLQSAVLPKLLPVANSGAGGESCAC
jgi:hypothetical protein